MSKEKLIKEVIDQTEEKLTLKEIAEKSGVSRSTTRRILQNIGYEYETTPWNKGLTKEDNATLLATSKKLEQRVGWKHSKETKEKISKSMIGKGGIREAAGRGEVWDYGDDVLNSDYELRIAQLLDEEGILWKNNNIYSFQDKDRITRMISLGFYLPEYGINMAVKYHINSDTRRRISLASKQNDVKVLIVDEMLYRRIMYNSIKEILKNSLQR
jgi:transcriptional regulator with XRE-family HTH domain